MKASDKHYEGSKLENGAPLQSYPLPVISVDGDIQPQKCDLIIEEIKPYFPSKELVDAIEYARLLGRPLLIRGEPGSGKTRLAQAVAFELYKREYRKKYFEWFIKSSTKVVEGLYRFDHLGRLRDVQRNAEKEPSFYRKFGPLGKAFLTSELDNPSILLIDEIDKADLDFPNDLLLELDQKRFIIPDTEEEIVAVEPPIMIITSNDEKDLPDAFLRRCVFHYIDFPDDDQLIKILKARAHRQIEEFKIAIPDELIESIAKRFRILYADMRKDQNTNKQPSTSELLDWLYLIHYYFLTNPKKITKETLLSQNLLFPEVLLKSLDDFKIQTNKKT